MTLSATLENATDLPAVITEFVASAVLPDPTPLLALVTEDARITDHNDEYVGDGELLRWAHQFTERRVSAQHFGVERDAHGITLLYRINTDSPEGPTVRRFRFTLNAARDRVANLTVTD
ncbi:hypothetical protein D9V34_01405 [Mycetocola lacteus]|uniref:Nuclear transport factor 2 family protein n=1 Tax=Mycetocola lacteus TaxID=76637 RepID=A0A3L7AN51_9MICO|nr:hypothetical protein [Mycetocola lacteus]RLP80898.1 hypothetical protein D9V34_13700 [Mycetocola lacteus]RLP84683.1 hypothetical protein D9V34_01405 [Mycetocola lacteus]